MPQWWQWSTLYAAAIGAVVSAVVWWIVWHGLETYRHYRARKWLRRLMRRLHERGPVGAVALAVSVSRPIEEHVRRFLDASEQTRGLELVVIHRDERLNDGGDWLIFLRQVRHEHRRLCAAGAGRFLLFCNIPVSMALGVGASLLPGPEVIVYHYEADANTYRELGLLNFDTVRS